MPTMTRTTWGLLLILSLLWGGSFFFIAVAVKGLPIFTIVWLRVAIAGAVLWGVIWISGLKIAWSRAGIIACFGMGVLNNAVPFTLIVYGQASIPSGLASILNATTPLFTVVATHVLTQDDKLTVQKLSGVALGIAGVAVLVGPDVLGSGAPVLAQLAILGAAFSYGLGGVWSRRFKALETPLPVTAIAVGQLTASTLLMLPLMLVLDRPWAMEVPGLPAILSVIGLAVVSTALAYILFFRILDLAGPTNVSLVTFLIPVSATGLGWAFLSERLGIGELIGALLIGAGLAAMDGRLLRWLRHQVTPNA